MSRPLLFQNEAELQERISNYFYECDNRIQISYTKDGDMIEVPNPRPYTISGLAYFLGTNRQTLLNYEQRDEFFDTIRAAKAKIEMFVEESLWLPKVASGVMFNLKNNFNWVDKQNVEHSGEQKYSIKLPSDIDGD